MKHQQKIKNNNLLTEEVAGDEENSGTYSRDSANVIVTPTDPPKNGTHWRSSDSIQTTDDTTDPPKNGTHWRKKISSITSSIYA
ncbi:hypothetical protein [Chryseobacterium aquaeductus]|uniref:hypothetical protein n=1 Tax=Chryseobacterium aquaeductus TaxID=2675056 RepID=UPI0013897BD8|nr:hypothetical protein [Chryseobacterium aquaeductus]